MQYKNIKEKISLIKENKISLVENVKDFLNRIEQRKNLNAFNFVFGDEALQLAEIIEQKIKSGNHGKLAGAVIAIKDGLSYKTKMQLSLVKQTAMNSQWAHQMKIQLSVQS